MVKTPEASISSVEALNSTGTLAVVPIEIEVAESIVKVPDASISSVLASISIGLS